MMNETRYAAFFTPEEWTLKGELETRLCELVGDSLRDDDMQRIEALLAEACILFAPRCNLGGAAAFLTRQIRAKIHRCPRKMKISSAGANLFKQILTSIDIS